MAEVFAHFVGIDWGEAAYQVCVTDIAGHVLREQVVEHTGEGLGRFADELMKLSGGCPQRVAVAIETTAGAMVDTLVENGFSVHSINPKQLDRFRDRHTIAGAKDDRRDAFVLADALRTDTHLFRRLKLDEPMLIELRELSRLRGDLVIELRRLANQLRQQLHRYFPQVLRISSAADDPWIWTLLEAVPTPSDVDRLSRRKLMKILENHRIRRVGPQEVTDRLGAQPLPVAPGVVEAASSHVKLLLPRLQLVNAQLKGCDKSIDERLRAIAQADPAKLHDVTILLSLPGVGRSVAATMLAEASQTLAARDYATLRALAGVSPVTKRSGKSYQVLMRRACNQRLRNAAYHMARTHVLNDTHGKRLYDAMRARGLNHARALRGVADRLLQILIAMLRSGSTYKPELGEGNVSAPDP